MIIDRLLGKWTELFGLVGAWGSAYRVCLPRTSVGNNSINLIVVLRGKLPFDSKDLDVDRIREHCHVPNISSGLQIVGGMYPDSSHIRSIKLRVVAFAMCRKFHVTKYSMPLTVAIAMCNASRGSELGIPWCFINICDSALAGPETSGSFPVSAAIMFELNFRSSNRVVDLAILKHGLTHDPGSDRPPGQG